MSQKSRVWEGGRSERGPSVMWISCSWMTAGIRTPGEMELLFRWGYSILTAWSFMSHLPKHTHTNGGAIDFRGFACVDLETRSACPVVFYILVVFSLWMTMFSFTFVLWHVCFHHWSLCLTSKTDYFIRK